MKNCFKALVVGKGDFMRNVPQLSRILAFSLLSFLGGIKAYSQFQKPDIRIPSPNAASLGLYGEVPVSLYTGTPNIDIPIYTLQEGKIKVPISLSYHASGVRVNQHPGWVGLNWNLNAGGAITRVIKDAADDYDDGGNTSAKGYYYMYNDLNVANWETAAYAKTEAQVAIDTEPDEFSFNFMGYSGKFYLNHLRQWVVKSNSFMKITTDANFLPLPADLTTTCDGYTGLSYIKTSNSFRSFTITVEDGTQFVFGGSGSSIEYSMAFFGQMLNQSGIVPDIWVANTWYLTKIKTKEGQEVNFNYSPPTDCANGKFIASFSASWSASQYDYSSLNGLSGLLGRLYNHACASSNFSIPTNGFYGGTLTRPTYLSSITSNSHTISFGSSVSNEMKYEPRMLSKFFEQTTSYQGTIINNVPSNIFPFLNWNSSLGSAQATQLDRIQTLLNKLVWRKLDNIIISDANNNRVSTFGFGYNTASDNSKRLMLTKISQMSTDISQLSCQINHNFEYYSDYTLPPYLAQYEKTDHWGFFNNANNGNGYDLNGLISNYNGFVNSKTPSTDINVLRSGSLKKIIYPTGGSTEFIYEPHNAYKIKETNDDGTFFLQSGSFSVGGLRVKSIIINDGTVVKQKDYQYIKTDGSSSGISSGNHLYRKSYTMNSCNTSGTYTSDILSIQNTLPLSVNSLGSSIGYSRVVEKETISNGTSPNGYKVYNYTNYESIDGGHMDEAVAQSLRIGGNGNKYEPFIDKSFERGLLLSEETYNASNQLVLKKTITYQALSNDYVRAIYTNGFFACSGTGLIVCSGFPYRINTYQYKPVSETIYQYDQTDASKFTTEVKDYLAYNPLGMPTQIKTTRNGKSATTYNKYVADYPSFYFSPNSNTEDVLGIWGLQFSGAYGILVEQVIANNDGSDNTQRYVDGYLNIFRSYPGISGMNNVQLYQTLKYVPTALSTSFTPSTISLSGSTNIFVKDANFSKVVVQFPPMDSYGVNDAYTSFGEPIRYKGSDGVWNSFTWGTGTETGLLKSKTTGTASLAQTINYSYLNPLVGVSQITDPNGFATKYEYDGFNRLKVVKDYSDKVVKSYSYNLKNSNPFSLTIINIGQSQQRTMPGSNVPLSAWSNNFVTVDAGPDLDNSTESNPSIFYTNNVNKGAPRFWTIYVGACNLGTSGAIGYDMLLSQPESGAAQSFNTIENNAAYLMYANSDNFTTLYAQNHPTYGFTTATSSNPTNLYDSGLPKGLYKLVIRYWSQKGTGAWPSIRTPLGVVVAIKEYWFRIQSQQGIGQGPP